MKKTEYILGDKELLIRKKDGDELKISYKSIILSMLGITSLYFLGYIIGFFLGNIIN